VFHINTQIPWHRPETGARIYRDHGRIPRHPPPFSRRLLCTSASPPRLLRSSTLSTLLYHHRHYRARANARAQRRARLPSSGTLPLAGFERPPARPLPHYPPVLRAFDRAGNLRFPFHRGPRPSCTAPPDAFVDRPSLSHPGCR
jgi:hypothetical protein